MLDRIGFLRRLFQTHEQLSEAETSRGVRLIVYGGILAMGAGALQGGVFLTDFALKLSASNYEIGLLTTAGLGAQLMQVPGLALLSQLPKRRAIVTISALISRCIWLFPILIPVLFIDRGVSFLLFWLFVAQAAMAVCVPSWNSLLRDIVPTETMGRTFSRRLAFGSAVALGLTLGGGYFADWWGANYADHALFAYSILFGVGLLFGLAEVPLLARLPEPEMAQDGRLSIIDLLKLPVSDANFRPLLSFIAIWNLAINAAAPFFAVYMLKRIGLSLFVVTVLVLVNQLFNLLFLRIWGKIADRFSNKSVLSVCCPLFLLAILGFCFTTLPERYSLTIPLLFVIHAVMGIATAGISLSSTNIALKLSPSGAASSYMTAYGMAGSLAGALAPILGGALADFFAVRELSLSINWSDPEVSVSLYALNFRALDFLFGFSCLVGFLSLGRLRRVQEMGEVQEREVVMGLVNEVVMPFRTISFTGIKRLAILPPDDQTDDSSRGMEDV